MEKQSNSQRKALEELKALEASLLAVSKTQSTLKALSVADFCSTPQLSQSVSTLSN